MSSETDRGRGEGTPAAGAGLPDDVEPETGQAPDPTSESDGVPHGAGAEAEAIARAVAEADRAAAEADRTGAADDDGDPLAGAEPGADPADVAGAIADDDHDEDEGAAEATAADGDEPGAGAGEEVEPDWQDRYLRVAAELENVRRRARRDVAAGEARGLARLARELLPALDDLDRTVAHLDEAGARAPDPDSHEAHLITATRTVHQHLGRALQAVGVEVDRPEGEAFDPHRHEALTQQPAPEGVEPGTIVAVYQAGYRRGEDVLRAARVVVAG